AFGFSMWLTGEPQYVGVLEMEDNLDGVWNTDDIGGGHAMIVYGATADGLYVADPNYAQAFRVIPWKADPAAAAGGVLGPYNTAAEFSDPPEPYEVIGYYAKSALIDWSDLAGKWPEFVAGTVGDDILPSFTVVAEYDDADGNHQTRPFRDRLIVALEEIELTLLMADSGDCGPYQPAPNDHLRAGSVEPCHVKATFYEDTTVEGSLTCERSTPGDDWTCSTPTTATLAEGDTEFGVFVEVERIDEGKAIRPCAGGPTNCHDWEYVDFDRFVITRGSGLALEMLPDGSEAAGLDMLVKDAPTLVENPDVPGEIIAITASYKAGPAVEDQERAEPGAPYVPGWKVIPPVTDDVCMGTGFGGSGFGPQLCIDVRISLWDGDPSPFDPVAVRTEALDNLPAVDPCRIESGTASGREYTTFTLTDFPCVDSLTTNADQGVEIFGFDEEDRNLGISRYQVRAVVGDVRIDVTTAYRNHFGADVRTDRMREVVIALVNEIARSIRVVSGG
ncbi:hypothetical protein HQ535_10170, partial [bacterium]|nr:hypothetical protein [bacterium]